MCVCVCVCMCMCVLLERASVFSQFECVYVCMCVCVYTLISLCDLPHNCKLEGRVLNGCPSKISLKLDTQGFEWLSLQTVVETYKEQPRLLYNSYS